MTEITKKTPLSNLLANSRGRWSWKSFETDGVQNESDPYAMSAHLKEFKLLAEKYLFNIPVINQIYINTRGASQNLSLKENEKRGIHFSFIPELTEDGKRFDQLVVEHLVAPWQLSHAFLCGTSNLV